MAYFPSSKSNRDSQLAPTTGPQLSIHPDSNSPSRVAAFFPLPISGSTLTVRQATTACDETRAACGFGNYATHIGGQNFFYPLKMLNTQILNPGPAPAHKMILQLVPTLEHLQELLYFM